MKDNRTLLQGTYWQINSNLRYGVPGYLFVTQIQGRSDQFSDVPPQAFGELGQFIGLAAAALEDQLSPLRVLTGKFGMVPGFSLHFHVFPLYQWFLDDFEDSPGFHALQRVNPAGYPAKPDAAELIAFAWRKHCFTGASTIQFDPNKIADQLEAYLRTNLSRYAS